MQKLSLLCLSLLMALCAFGTEYSLTYQGFPYKKTQCADPTYPSGTKVKLSSGTVQNDEGQWLTGWKFNRRTYNLGAEFTMPAVDVVLVPVWGKSQQGIDDVTSQESKVESQKILRNGQLIIVRGGIEYNVLGARVR